MAKMWFVVAAAIIMLTNGISAKKYTVGDEEGWKVPDSPDFYSSWAAKHTFEVDDTLVFDFTGVHTVALVTKEGFDKCDGEGADTMDKPTEITLKEAKSFYFICTIGSHCDSGQKFAVKVGSPEESVVPPAMAPTTAPTATSEMGSSHPITPLTSTFFCVTFMAFVLAFLYY